MCFGIWLDAVFFPLAGPCRTRQRAAPVRRLYIEVEIGKVCRGEVVPAGRILFGYFHSLIIEAFGRRLRSPPVLCQSWRDRGSSARLRLILSFCVSET